MPDPIAHLATALPDGSIASRYTQLPDGSWAPVTNTGGAPCCCGPGGCECVLPGSRYDIVPRTESQNDNITVDIRLDRCFTEIEYTDGTLHRAELLGPPFVISASINTQAARVDLSRKGRCAFGTSYSYFGRDIHPQVTWDGLGEPFAMIGKFSENTGRYNEILSSWHQITLDAEMTVRHTTQYPGQPPITIDTEAVVILLIRFVCDSKGIDRSREGIESRVPSVFRTFGPADEIVPGAMMEYAIALGYEENTVPGAELLTPCGTTLFSPFVNPLPAQALSSRAVVLTGGFLQASFISGQTYAGITIGEFPVGVIGGNHPAYPSSPAISPTNFAEIVEYGSPVRSAVLGDDALTVSYSDTTRLLRRLQAQFEPNSGNYSRIESLTDIDSVSFSFRHNIALGGGSNRASHLRPNQGWVPGTDISGSIPNDLPVGVYRKCGTPCEDKFVYYWDVANDIILGASRIKHRGDVYYYVGRDYIETPNGDLLESGDYEFTRERCDGVESWPVAVSCDGTLTITYDPSERPPGTNTCLLDNVRYTPTTEESTTPPTAGLVWDAEPCPSTDDVYRINICGSTTRAGGGVIEGDNLIPKVIGYRPGNGLVPGQGMVWVHIPVATGSGTICLHRVACQPTTEVVTDAEVVLTSIADQCRGKPVASVDPRPGCTRVDGGGGVQPSDTLGINAPQDPALQAELERQAQMRTGQFPGRCPSCGG